jgi:hypothetical protein
MSITSNTIVCCLDVTGSMSGAIVAVQKAVKCAGEMLGLFGIKMILVPYGDYDAGRKRFEYVVSAIRPTTTDELVRSTDRLQINMHGSGGDGVEALNSALKMVEQHIPQKSAVIVITDNCGDTAGECKNCLADKVNREPEINQLMQMGLKKGQCNFRSIMSNLAQSKECVPCLIKSKKCTPDKIYEDFGGITMIGSMSEQMVTESLFTILTNVLNLTPTKQLTKSLPYDVSAKWTQTEINTFRQIILKNPQIITSFPASAIPYFEAIKRVSRERDSKEKDFNAHADFVKNLRDAGISDLVVKVFKNMQHEQSKEPIDRLQKDDDLERICAQSLRYTDLADVLMMTKPSQSFAELQRLIESVVVVDRKNKEFKNGLSKQLVLSDPKMLFAYFGRDGLHFIKFGKTHQLIMYCAIIRWSKDDQIKDAVVAEVGKEGFLDANAIICNAYSYNMTYLNFIWRTMRKLTPDTSSTFQKMYKLAELAQTINNAIPLEYVQDCKTMTLGSLIGFAQGVGMAVDVVLGFWFPSNLFVRCDKQTVTTRTKFLADRNIITPERAVLVNQLVERMGSIFLSTYTIYSYNDDWTDDTIYGQYMTQSFVNHPVDLTDFEKAYIGYIGKDGENIHQTMIDRKLIRKNGPIVKLCSDKKCGVLYGVHNTTNSPTPRCVACRTEHRVEGDHAPSFLVPRKSIACEKGHMYAVGYDTDQKIRSECCPICTIDFKKVIDMKKVSFDCLCRENIDIVVEILGVARPVMERLLRTMSAFNTAVDRSDDGTFKPNPDFVEWNTRQSEIVRRAQHTESQQLGADQLRIGGCLLTERSRESVLELMKNRMNVMCAICTETVPVRHIAYLCSNKRCAGDICNKCVDQMYPDVVPTGRIPKTMVGCQFCREQINRGSVKNKPMMRQILKSQKIKAGTHEYRSIAHAILSNETVYRCTEKSCKDLVTFGIFVAEKTVCGADDGDSAEHICPACTDHRMGRAREMKKTETLDTVLDLLGFTMIDGRRYRRCPNCAEAIDRTHGCAHMTCRCGQHFCWCHGIEFPTAGETYDHLEEEFGTMYPTDDEIQQMAR